LIVIIQARSSSKRFPNKVLFKINKIPLILHIINRIKLSKKVKKIAVATSTDKTDDKLVYFLKKNKINYKRGSLKNVALRLYGLAKKEKVKYFLRISGDSPLIDPKIIDRAIILFSKKKNFDIITNVFPRTYPSGQSVEIIKTKLLKDYLPSMNLFEKEHVTAFFYSNSKKFNIINFKNDNIRRYIKNKKLSVDVKSDIKKILKFFAND
jgi:spore coat polysaccharide biosynthesis protein SpsF